MQTALLTGIGGLTLYNALKPNEQKTIIVHEGATPAAPVPGAPAPVAALPAASPVPVVNPSAVPINTAVPVAVDGSTTPVANAMPSAGVPVNYDYSSTSVPIAPSPQAQPTIPLAPLPDAQPSIPLATMPDNQSQVPLAPILEVTTNSATIPTAQETTSTPVPTILPNSTQTNPPILAETTTGVPLAPFPGKSGNDVAHASLKGAASSINAFNLSFYACLTLVLVKLF